MKDRLTDIKKALSALTPNEDEKQIANLIIAALDNGILDKDSAEDLGDGYFRFRIQSDPRAYTICLGVNPNREKYKGAERALRASEFVTRLLNLINSDYNCYVVPTRITPPSPSAVNSRLSGTYSYTVDFAYLSKSSISADTGRSFELEVVIIAAAGDRYERITDNLAVNLKGQISGKKVAEFEYREIEHPTVEKDEGGFVDMIDREAVNEILVAVNSNENKQKILETLASSEKSRFHSFLSSLSSEGGDIVGQINVQPCSVFVCATPEQEFVYHIGTADSDKKLPLTIVWNSQNDISISTPLFVIAKEGKFLGLGCRPEYKDETGAVIPCPQLTISDTVIPVMKVDENEKCVISEVTLLPPPGTKDAPMYKGVADYAVYVGKCSSKFRKGYYLKSHTVHADSEYYLSADCEVCNYSGLPCWKGSLSPVVSYMDQFGMLKEGKINSNIYTSYNKRTCKLCGKVFYCDQTRYNYYAKNYMTLDGKYCCPQCNVENKIVENNGKSYKLLYNVISPSFGTGKIFALMNKDGEFVAPDNGGNVFKCSNCFKIAAYDKTNDKKCEVCGERICSVCNGAYRHRLYTGQHICASCPRDGDDKPAISKNTDNSGKKIFTCHEMNEGNVISVADIYHSPKHLFHCAVCGKLTYLDPNQSSSYKCQCCGRLMDKSCYNSLSPDPFFKLKLCSYCKKETETEAFIERKNSLLEKDRRLAEENAEILKDRETMFASWQDIIDRDLSAYLPYLNQKDKMAAFRAKKAGRNLRKIYQVQVIEYGKDEKNRIYVHFEMEFVRTKRKYTFYFKNRDVIPGYIK